MVSYRNAFRVLLLRIRLELREAGKAAGYAIRR